MVLVNGATAAKVEAFEKAYLHRGNMRSFFDWVMRLRRTIGIETHFANVSPRGKVPLDIIAIPITSKSVQTSPRLI